MSYTPIGLAADASYERGRGVTTHVRLPLDTQQLTAFHADTLFVDRRPAFACRLYSSIVAI